MMSKPVDLPEILEAFKCYLHAEDASRNTTSAYLSDLSHFVSWRGKGNKARRVPLNAEARAVIRDYLQVRPSCKILNFLIGQRGEPLSAQAIYDVVAKYGRLAGLDEVSSHILRHTFARTLLVSGTSINDVADLLGTVAWIQHASTPKRVRRIWQPLWRVWNIGSFFYIHHSLFCNRSLLILHVTVKEDPLLRLSPIASTGMASTRWPSRDALA